eukprot:symbB.v1.2.025050.t1/scaffold2412.1/size81594/1
MESQRQKKLGNHLLSRCGLV